MFSEIFGLLSSIDVSGNGTSKKFRLNLNRNRIRSISAFSSNSIFYFPCIVSEQCTPEEAMMVSRLVERMNASFVVACISLMPFHRVKADDKAAIEDYLAQFHQNIGIDPGNGAAMQKLFGLIDNVNESARLYAEKDPEFAKLQNFLYECWQKSLKENSDYVTLVAQELSLNEMYTKDHIDPKTRFYQAQFMEKQDELNTWGFIGEATDKLFDDLENMSLEDLLNDDEDLDDDDEEDDEITMAIEYDLDENNIMSLHEGAFGIQGIIDAVKKAFGIKTENDRKNEFTKLSKTMNPNIVKFNYQKAYQEWYITSVVNNKTEAEEAAKLTCAFAKVYFNTDIHEVMIAKVSDFMKEYNIRKDATRYDANQYLIAVPCDAFGDNISNVKDQLNGRYFTDIVDNAVRIMMDRDKNYKPKSYIDMGNIEASRKFLDNHVNESINGVLTEGTVKEAINSIAFSLESVSENKILSCKNLTKLRSLEAKLNKLKNKYVKYLNRYKKKYNENKKAGTTKKLAIRFNGLSISNPKEIINKRLKLVEKRREELRKRSGKDSVVEEPKETTTLKESALNELTELSDRDLEIVDYCIEKIDECLNAPDSEIFTLIDEATKGKSGHLLLNPDEARQYEKDKRSKDALIKNARNASKENDRLKQQLERERKNAERYQTLFRNQKEKNKEQATAAKSTTVLPNRDMPRKDEGGDDEFDIVLDRTRPKGGINPYRAVAARHAEFKTFGDKVFTDMDMKKANDAVPTFAKASIGFVIDETEEVVSRDVLIGIKAYIHRAPSTELVNDIYNGIINKRKFLRFVKFVTGEERSLADLVFGFKELRNDALDAKSGSGQWRSAFKRRRRWAKISVPYLMKEYTPNGTIVMTMNEVDYIKSEYGIDVMTQDHVKMIMDTDFLLSFIIVDQANEMVYVTYDGHGYGFQTYTYAMLEREAQASREVLQLYRALSNR